MGLGLKRQPYSMRPPNYEERLKPWQKAGKPLETWTL